MSPNAFRSVVEIDLLGSYHVLRAAYPLLRKPGAVVINVSAPQAFLPMALQSHVCAAKAGVDMLTRVLAIEWGGDGIRVNSVVPGPIEGTEGMTRLAPTPEAREIVRTTVPAGRWGIPRDVADVCLLPGIAAGGLRHRRRPARRRRLVTRGPARRWRRSPPVTKDVVRRFRLSSASIDGRCEGLDGVWRSIWDYFDVVASLGALRPASPHRLRKSATRAAISVGRSVGTGGLHRG
jgi:hypothetical protein